MIKEAQRLTMCVFKDWHITSRLSGTLSGGTPELAPINGCKATYQYV